MMTETNLDLEATAAPRLPTPTSETLRVVVEEMNGERLDAKAVTDNYVIVAVGKCYVEHVTRFQNGTHVITVKHCTGPLVEG